MNIIKQSINAILNRLDNCDIDTIAAVIRSELSLVGIYFDSVDSIVNAMYEGIEKQHKVFSKTEFDNIDLRYAYIARYVTYKII